MRDARNILALDLGEDITDLGKIGRKGLSVGFKKLLVLVILSEIFLIPIEICVDLVLEIFEIGLLRLLKFLVLDEPANDVIPDGCPDGCRLGIGLVQQDDRGNNRRLDGFERLNSR